MAFQLVGDERAQAREQGKRERPAHEVVEQEVRDEVVRRLLSRTPAENAMPLWTTAGGAEHGSVRRGA